MSCGKTPTRRQEHGKRRVSVAKKHAGKIGNHRVTPPARGHKRIVIVRHVPPPLPRPKQKVTPSPRKMAHSKLSARERRALRAWERRHPFKRMTRAQFRAWERAHPLKHGGHTPSQGKTHRVACHIKTRHAAARHHKRIVIHIPPGARKSQKARRPVSAQKALRAR